VDAMEEYMKAIDKPSMEFYTVYKIFPMIPKYYGVESKKYLPRLKAYLNEIPDRFVQVQMITDVTKKTIEQIEKTTEKKKLVRIRDYVK